jgi:hypothetical protein
MPIQQRGPWPSKSKYKTGPEARAALDAAGASLAEKRKRLYAEMNAAREPLLAQSAGKRTKEQEKELEGIKFLTAQRCVRRRNDSASAELAIPYRAWRAC